MSDLNNTRARNDLRLTVENIRAMAVGDELHDHVIDGLSIRRKARGLAWWLQYSDARGDRRRPKLGTYPDLGLDPARAAAKALKQRIARGEDPSGEKRAARAAPRVGECFDVYLAEHVAGRLKPRTVELYTQCIEVMRPVLGTLRMADVTPDDVRRALRKFGGPYAANSGHRVFRAFWNTTAANNRAWDLKSSPTDPIAANPSRRRKRVATPAELRVIVAALEARRAQYPERVRGVVLCARHGRAYIRDLRGASAASHAHARRCEAGLVRSQDEPHNRLRA